MDNEQRIAAIQQRLSALQPLTLEIEDHSEQHKNHPGAKESGGGHFKVNIVSEKFNQLPMVARHRLIYDSLNGLMGSEIHALSINARSPQEG